jgi:hypothetical protein
MLAALQKAVHPVVQKCQSYHKELEVLHMQVLQAVVTAQEVVTEALLVVMVEVLVVSLEE